MPRAARIVVTEVAHHITQRGNNRQDVFFVDDDRLVYLELLRKNCEKYGMRVQGYCLMTNHVHLVAIPEKEESPAKAIGQTHFCYSQYINRFHKRSGQKQTIVVNDIISPDNIIYSVEYEYDVAGRLKNVGEPLQQYGYQNIAGFDYDKNGNRSQLMYYRTGSEAGPTVSVDYTYNLDNYLTKFATAGGPTYTFGGTYGPQSDWAKIDGLGRLCDADETISKTSGTVDFSYGFDYDMRSQLKQASIDKNSSPYWNAEYNYRKDGNLDSRQIQEAYSTFTYDGDLLLTASTSSPQDGLVGHWKMDDNAPNPNVADSSVYGNNGTFNDPTGNPNTDAHDWTGEIDGALTFDGTDDYVNCGGDSSLMNRQTLTASAWINGDSFSRGDGYNVFMVVCLEQAVSEFDWGLRVDSGFPKFWVRVPTGYKSATPASTISTGQWYHLAGTWDRYGGSDNLKIYVNGVLKATNTVNENLRTYGTQVAIGRELHPTVNEYFDGAIDDVQIYDRELSSDEIKAIYNRGFSLGWDDNGNMTATDMINGTDTTLQYNWDNKLRSATKGAKSISLRYDPGGNRIWKQSIDGAGQITHKYIVDIVGDLPTILMEMTDNTILKTYIYANGQPLCQNDGDYSAPRYFYIHDRLGSVRQIINTSGSVVRYYTYEPFGEVLEEDGTLTNYMMFTGQYFDTEIDQYYLRARQYDPHISRFTARDPVLGRLQEPLTLHVYLYCINDPVNKIDPFGRDYIDFNFTWAYGMVPGMLQGAIIGGGASWNPVGAGIGAGVGMALGGFGATGGLMFERNEAHFYLGPSWTTNPVGGIDFTMSVCPFPYTTVETGWHVGIAGIYGGGYTQWTRNLQQGGDAWEFGMTTGGTMALGASFSLFYVFSGMQIPYITDGDPRSAFSELDLIDRAIMMNTMREDTAELLQGGIAGIGFISVYGVTADQLLGM